MSISSHLIKPVKQHFGSVIDASGVEKEVFKFVFNSSKGTIIKISSYGAALNSIQVPDINGILDHVILGFDDAKSYLGFNFIGSTVGRNANRIKNGKFKIDGEEYHLVINNNTNHLHGGKQGWDKYVWSDEIIDDKLVFSLLSQDKDQGYPGTVIPQVTYSLSEDGSLRIDFQAISTKSTPINMTNHAFFNLGGHASGQKGIYEHKVQVFADRYTPITEDLIPTGELLPVADTPYDLTKGDTFGHYIVNSPDKGYDHNFCLQNKERGKLQLSARFHHPPSGRSLEVFSTEPGVQIYTGNFLPKEKGQMVGRDGVSYMYQGAFCCEPQNFPDAINHSDFPDGVLRPGDIYKSAIVYKFTTEI